MTDQTLKILLEIKSDVSDLQKVIGGLKEVGTASETAAKSGFGMKEAFQFSGANEVLHRLIETLKQIPEHLYEAIKQGVEFNAELQKVQTAIAGLFRQESPTNFPTFEAAKVAAGDTIELLKKKANELGVSYTAMFESFEHATARSVIAPASNAPRRLDRCRFSTSGD